MSQQECSTGEVREQKVTAERDDEFVVFHIGMRINAFWKIHRWLPLLLVAPRMVRELMDNPESGLLGSRTVLGPGVRHIGFVQYWESFESLRAYARDGDRLHYPAWQEYYQHGTKADAAVGIWHETYLVSEGEYETVYNNMPAHGLAACDDTEINPAKEQRTTATDRLASGHGPEDPTHPP
ncbi:DUF4188 domain-containing protein [Halorubrum sp. CBA1125]|uniref:DUF4188 domain-containing protein n=1 Tax=Halorubrum sp. CBA1125 TaxID=2668072 RepID=UPI0012E7B848|nr:DUF4188 domain-containing protein [Halorubrum sp. CBA1125]MUW13895.1 DUF4188 domain-containing protein [Halorubrum sp. CBA1125]